MSKRKKTPKVDSLPLQIMKGGVCGFLLFVMIIAIFSYLIYHAKISFPGNAIQLLLLGVCAFFSALIGYRRIGENRLLLSYGSGLCLFLLLSILSALFFGIDISQIPIYLLTVFLGCTLYFLLGLIPAHKRYHH